MKLQNHYKDGFFDVCAEHGFLPVKDPIVSLPSTYADVQKILDDMPVVLPDGEHGLLHHEGSIMKAIEALENHLEDVKKEDEVSDAIDEAIKRLSQEYPGWEFFKELGKNESDTASPAEDTA